MSRESAGIVAGHHYEPVPVSTAIPALGNRYVRVRERRQDGKIPRIGVAADYYGACVSGSAAGAGDDVVTGSAENDGGLREWLIHEDVETTMFGHGHSRKIRR